MSARQAPLGTPPRHARRGGHRPERDRSGRLGAAEASEGMLVARLEVPVADVVFLKGVVEASEGIASVFADAGGELTLAAPRDRAADLEGLVAELVTTLDLDAPRRIGFAEEVGGGSRDG